MRCLRLLLAFILALSLPAMAQEDEDKAFLESWLQDKLSDAGRQISITGFRGALSSNATMDELTIADDDGVWITVRNAELSWSRLALLRGRLDVTELSAEEIDLVRIPTTEGGVSTEDTEATGFAIPELPVSIDVEQINAAQVTLGEAVLGQTATLSLNGSFALEDGTGRTSLDIQRLDRDDQIALTASFSNETRVLAIDLDVQEGEGGLISELIGIHEAPDLRLTVTGDAPLSDFDAQIALSSDGVPRLTGAVRIAAVDDTEEALAFSADLGGDMRALFPPDLRAFFGDRTALRVAGQTRADGGLVLDTLDLSAEALTLRGALSLGQDGFPERFDLSGQIGDGQSLIRLPVAGDDPTRLRRATLSAQYDQATGQAWTTDLSLEEFTGPDVAIESASLSADGTLTRDPRNTVTADIAFDLSGLSHSDPALAAAMGPTATGTTQISWTEDTPLQIPSLVLQSGDVSLSATGQVEALADGFPVTGNARLDIPVLARFAPIAERDLAGSVRAQLSGTGAILGGTFDLSLTARTLGLALGEDRLDPLLTGSSTLQLAAMRSTEGTFLETLILRNPHLFADISGQLNTRSGALDVTARLNDISRVEPRVTGPATLDTGLAWTDGQPIRLTDFTLTAADATLSGTATLDPAQETLPVTGDVTLFAQDLSRLSQLADRTLGGQINMRLAGSGDVMGTRFDAEVTAQSTDLVTGTPQLDPLLEGLGALTIIAARDGQAYTLDTLRLTYPKLSTEAEGAYSDTSATLSLSANVTDLTGTVDGFSGPAQLDTAIDWDRGGKLTVTRLTASAVETGLSATGAIWPDDPDLPVEGDIALSVQNLARFAGLTSLPLTGQVTLDASGRGAIGAPLFDATIGLDGQNLRTGIAALDTLLAGSVSLEADSTLSENSAPDIRKLDLTTPNLSVRAAGTGPGTPVSLNARLANMGLFVPGFNGPVAADGTLTLRDNEARDIGVNLNATAPNGIVARVTGDVRDYGQALAISANGSAPLALANTFIAPRSVEGLARFDLAVNGPPALSSASGQVTISDTRVSLPQANFALNDISGTVGLGNSQARLAMLGTAGTGGRFELRGPITLAPPFASTLTLVLTQLGITDPDLYSTTANGAVTIDGPLTGGARIGGTINLGTTELRVPSGGGSLNSIPDITHVGEPQPVRGTRQRAGLIKELEGTGGTPFPLDLTINAPNQIFLRGRGLDAELGGTVRLFGNTSDVRASGTFELIRGRLDILGQRLLLTEGLIDLRGALDPFLRIVAETTADDVVVQVILEGLASDPNVTFQSVPELPQEEVAARLLFGRGLDNISPFQAAQLVAAAATLSGQRSGGLTGGLRNSLGLSDLDVSTTEEGGTELRAGAYISENIYSEVAVDSEGNEEINLNIDLNPSLTVKGTAGSDGNTGIGIFFERDY